MLKNRVDTGIDVLNYMVNDDKSDKVVNGIHKAADYIIYSSNEKQSLDSFQEKVNHKVFVENSNEEILNNIEFDNNQANIQVFIDKHRENVEIPFYLFKGIVVAVDGEISSVHMSNNGSPVVKVGSGVHNIVISYRKTMLQKFSFIISLLSVLSMFGYVVIIYFSKENKNEKNIHRRSLLQ